MQGDSSAAALHLHPCALTAQACRHLIDQKQSLSCFDNSTSTQSSNVSCQTAHKARHDVLQMFGITATSSSCRRQADYGNNGDWNMRMCVPGMTSNTSAKLLRSKPNKHRHAGAARQHKHLKLAYTWCAC